MNTDGTVNSSVRYTYGFQNFYGDIEIGDAFGSSVSYFPSLRSSDGVLVGSFSDNGEFFEEGSAYILQLGEVLAINEFSDNPTLSIFPNPTRNKFLFSETSQIASVAVYDLSGRRVVSYTANQKDGYDVSYLPIATYIISVELTNGTTQQFKLIKG